MGSKRVFFFFAKNDLLSMLRLVESASDFQYFRAGVFPTRDFIALTALSTLEGTGVSNAPSSVLGDHWLVGKRGTAIHYEQKALRNGNAIFVVNTGNNLGAVALSLGGEWNGEAIIRGEVSLTSDNEVASDIFPLFSKSVRSLSQRFRGMYVGHDAFARSRAGWRLTDDVRSPMGYDLRLDPSV